jgi:hypothetical protein
MSVMKNSTYAAKVRAADRALRKLESARHTLRLETGRAPDGISMPLAVATDALTTAIQHIGWERKRTVDLIAEIAAADDA